MGFSSQELSVIHAAKQKAASAWALRIFLIIAVVATAFLAAYGEIDAQICAIIAVVVALIAAFGPQISLGPKYEDLLNILESKLEQQPKL